MWLTQLFLLLFLSFEIKNVSEFLRFFFRLTTFHTERQFNTCEKFTMWTIKAHSHRVKQEAKAKIFFYVCHFCIWSLSHSLPFRSVWIDLKSFGVSFAQCEQTSTTDPYRTCTHMLTDMERVFLWWGWQLVVMHVVLILRALRVLSTVHVGARTGWTHNCRGSTGRYYRRHIAPV